MKNNAVKSITFAAAACLSVMPFFTFAEVKALSAAIDYNKGGNNTTLIKRYLATHNHRPLTKDDMAAGKGEFFDRIVEQ